MGDWAVSKNGKVIAIYTGEGDAENRAKAEAVAAGGTYGDGCTAGPYTPPPAGAVTEPPAAKKG